MEDPGRLVDECEDKKSQDRNVAFGQLDDPRDEVFCQKRESGRFEHLLMTRIERAVFFHWLLSADR